MRFLSWPVLTLIRIYRYAISPMLGNHCRFSPSCSEYALVAIQRHGLFKGVFLSVRRIGKCHPWHPGGFDPVPDTTQSGNNPETTSCKT